MPVTFELQRQLSRFRRLPASTDARETAIVDMPMWVDGRPNGEPYRPRDAVCVSAISHFAHLTKLKHDREAVGVEDVISTLCEMGTSSKRAGVKPPRTARRHARVLRARRR